jgi:Zn-dependent protease
VLDNLPIATILVSYVALLFSLSVHEASHATAAYWLEDDTAQRLGRMTINPIAHIDWIGTVLFPLMGMFTGFPFIGWAKPVPIRPERFTRKISMRAGISIVSAAGPLSNLLLSLIFLLLTTLVIRFTESSVDDRARLFMGALHGPENLMSLGGGTGLILLSLGGQLIIINIFLALFNLLPVGPLDGAGVLQGFLSHRAAQTFDRIRPYMFVVLIIAIFIRIPGTGQSVLGWCLSPVIKAIFGLLLIAARFLLGV